MFALRMSSPARSECDTALCSGAARPALRRSPAAGAFWFCRPPAGPPVWPAPRPSPSRPAPAPACRPRPPAPRQCPDLADRPVQVFPEVAQTLGLRGQHNCRGQRLPRMLGIVPQIGVGRQVTGPHGGGQQVVLQELAFAHAPTRKQPTRRGQPQVETLQISLRQFRPRKVPRVGRFAQPTNSDSFLSIDGCGSEGVNLGRQRTFNP